MRPAIDDHLARLKRRIRAHRGEPPAFEFRRPFLATLSGRGVEIGALHNPAPLPPEAVVTYVDQFDLEELRRRNPDVPPERIVPPDVIADSHKLDGIDDGSLDFVVASHVFEHLHNPIAALLEWRRVLRLGGVVLMIVPDGRFTFDLGRPFTSLDHLLWDFVNRDSELKRLNDLLHIAECNLNLHDHLDADSALELAHAILKETYDTHFHVWSFESLSEQLNRLVEDFALPFRIRTASSDNVSEMAFVLEAAHGALRPDSTFVPRAAR